MCSICEASIMEPLPLVVEYLLVVVVLADTNNPNPHGFGNNWSLSKARNA